MAKAKNKSAKPTLADLADKYTLYEQSVQWPEHEVGFFVQAFQEARQRQPYSLCEDFCGTFAVSCQWVASDHRRTAIAIDTCGEALQRGRRNNLSQLSDQQQQRVTLKQQDARAAVATQVDILAAQNFSFWIFKTRPELVDYLTTALSKLNDDGIMIIDMMGGFECLMEGLTHSQTIQEGRDGFKYQWKQVSYNPINSEACFAISFTFSDGSRLQNAFVYHWRLWTVVEIRELLSEVGFRATHVYWAIDEESDPGSDIGWARREQAPSDASWTCYIVALK